MTIHRRTLEDALIDPSPDGLAVIALIDEALAKGESVVLVEYDDSESLLKPGGYGGYIATSTAVGAR
ncbi:MAG: hypothetical protein ACRC1K_03780 [Planctomycetia bacterium]